MGCDVRHHKLTIHFFSFIIERERKEEAECNKHILLHYNIIPFILLYVYLIFLYFTTPFPIESATVGADNSTTTETVATTTKNDTTTTSSSSDEEKSVEWSEHDFYIFLIWITFGLHIVSELFKHWSVEYRCFVSLVPVASVSQADHVRVTPSSHVGAKTLCDIVHDVDQATSQDKSYFYFQKRKFTYDADKKQFVKIKLAVPTEVDDIIRIRGYDTQESLTNSIQRFGGNRFDIPIPAFLDLYKEQAMAPFFVFQVFCVLLWSLEEYVYYCLFTLFMLLTFEATVVKQRLRNLQSLRDMSSKPSYPIYVYRLNQWKQIDTTEILPGDVVSMVRGETEAKSVAPCDLLLLSGGVVVNEAMLTGESTPHHKESIAERSSKNPLDYKNDKIHIMYGGTTIVQHTPAEKTLKISKPPDKGCIAYALKTGFDTNQGRLMRTIWFSTERVTANNKESFLFIIFLLIFAIAASIYLFIRGIEDNQRSKYKLILHCIMVITSVVPPELPMELSLAVNNSLMSLVRLGIYCTEPFRIPLAGKVDVCCFDKTGTLTTDDLILQGIAFAPRDQPTTKKSTKQDEIDSDETSSSSSTATIVDPFSLIPAQDTSEVVGYLLAGCHSLVSIDGKLVGDPMETASLKSIPYTCKGDSSSHTKKKVVIEIINRYHFTSELKRMSTIANVIRDGGNKTGIYAFAKGAPEILKPMLKNVPTQYDDVYKKFSRQGSRVLALGYKEMDAVKHTNMLKATPREEVESGLEFGGFLIFDCPLKPDSKDAIERLASSAHQIVMITGDNSLTACHVAKQLAIMNPSNPTLILTKKENQGYTWVSVDETIEKPFQGVSPTHLLDLSQQHNLCVSGQTLDSILNNTIVEKYLYLVQVFARVSPEQKQLILANFKQYDHHTLMAGDGTNDVGALKQAHVGVAILNKGEMPPPRPMLGARDMIRQQQQQMQQIQQQQQGLTRQQQLAEMTKKLQEEMKEQEIQMVKLGDASIAAPFTSKSSRVIPVTHIIRQGRCTLVTTFQMYKILALNSLVSAYSLSVLYLDGVKLGDTQMTLGGMLIALCFLFISTSKPLEKLANKRPNPNLFSPYMMLSILLQFALHLACLIFIVREADIRTSDANRPKIDSTFEPNLVNSAVFLISNAMQVATFAVNYKGHPFMQSLRENRPLLYCLSAVWGLGAILSLEIMPDLNQYMELIPFPDDTFRNLMFGTIVVDLVGAFIIEKVCSTIFSS
ncbi:putative cation-transporting ATPase [Cavenderia fasciculata]|uniref:Cation-transporting ATPase n=1 Tax=Cavenderia fasciculata TaxID=261658 RepID=F4Q6R4_CACFS|nr:putative cation-transporting ATPase [Cavenderia fasciculata]EGG16574.1 putative cation-transporting ATPase [Cavenderia fasciculata]|eukprot:XP_004354974.1 putative cation-transporting ATPase [Cavenderia fasciculata]